MQTLYRTSFYTESASDLLAFDTVEPLLQVFDEWFDENKIELPLKWHTEWIGDIDERFKKEDGRFQFLQYPVGKIPNRMAFRVTNVVSDPCVHKRIVECVVGRAEAESPNCWRLTVAEHLAEAGRLMLAGDVMPRPPTVVSKFLQTSRCREGLPLFSGVQPLTEDDSEKVIGDILNHKRLLPVVILDQELATASFVDLLEGLAHTHAVDEAEQLQPLLDRNDLPGFPESCMSLIGPSESSRKNRGAVFWPLTEHRIPPVRKYLSGSDLIRLATGFSLQKTLPRLSSWDELLRHKTGAKEAHIGIVSHSREAKLMREQIKRKEKENKRIQKELTASTQKVRAGEILITRLLRADNLFEGLEAKNQSDLDNLVINLPSEAFAAARRDFVRQLDFDYIKWHDKVDCFLHPRKLYLAFKWLAKDYLRIRSEGFAKASNKSLVDSCRRHCGFSYAGGSSTFSTHVYEEDYQFLYRGRKVIAGEHLGWGVSRRPEQIIRVSFYYDEDLDRVVVYYVGKHQRCKIS